MNPKVAVIIVNWNGKRFLKGCLESIFNQTYPNYEVFVVDNGSNDGLVAFVQKNFPKTRIISLQSNTGFAKGTNIGISEAFKDKSVKYICTLNNDTKVKQNFLEEMVQTIEMDKRIGLVQAKLLFPDGLCHSAGMLMYRDLLGPDRIGISRGFGEKSEKYNKTEEIFAPSAAAALFRREMLEEIGLFDEDFFAYAEDLDLGLRARLFRWKCYFSPRAEVIHFHSQTRGAASPFKAYYVRRNTNFVAIKNLPFRNLIDYFFCSMINYFRLIFKIKKSDSSAGRLAKQVNFFGILKIVFKIYFDRIKYLPKMLKKRKAIFKAKTVSNKEINELFLKFSN